MMESFCYKHIGGWWSEKRKQDPCEIDIVAERLTGEVEVYEVKRNSERYKARRLEEKIEEMQRHIFKGRQLQTGCLSMDDMEKQFS